MMLIEPKIKGFICITAHPLGRQKSVESMAKHVIDAKRAGQAFDAAKLSHPSSSKQERRPMLREGLRALIIGGSAGYGLASRVVLGFGLKASTVNVSLERAAKAGRTASAGWYNSAAYVNMAKQAGLPCFDINGDAFDSEVKRKTIECIKKELSAIDILIYSVAAPKRKTQDEHGETLVYSSALKPIGKAFRTKTMNSKQKSIHEVEIPAASAEEIFATKKVMGGEDWESWVTLLAKENLLAPGFLTLAYSYIGPELTSSIYREGTIGEAKKHLEKTALLLNKTFAGRAAAFISVNKALVTQASAAIPTLPLYVSLLYKVMKEKNLHEDVSEQMLRLFSEKLQKHLQSRQENENEDVFIRLDDYEMRPDVQAEVKDRFLKIKDENLEQLADTKGYDTAFLNLFGFAVPGVDYQLACEENVPLSSLVE